MDISNFIQNVKDQDFNSAGVTFNELMMAKVTDALEQEKIKVAGQVFNGDDDEEQLELDLEGDEEDGAEDQGDDDEDGEEVEITGDEEELDDDSDDDEEEEVEDEDVS